MYHHLHSLIVCHLFTHRKHIGWRCDCVSRSLFVYVLIIRFVFHDIMAPCMSCFCLVSPTPCQAWEATN